MARQRGDSWQADITVASKRHRVDGFASREAAELWEAQAKADLKLGKPLPPANVAVLGRASGATLDKMIERTYAVHWKGNKSADDSLRNAEAASAFFGPKRAIGSITRSDCAKFVEHLRATTNNSDATINRKLAALSRVLTYAEEVGEIAQAPKLTGLRRREHENRERFIDMEEEQRILQTFKLWGCPEMVDFVVFLIDSGARWASEGLTLRHERVNLKQGIVTFTADLTKNKKNRGIPMSARLKEIMERRSKRADGLIFGDLSEAFVRHRWDRMKTHLGLAEDDAFTPHCLRHTCASRLVQNGMDLYGVQKWLGHSTMKMTMRYAHLAPTHLQTGREILDRINAQAAAQMPGPLLVGK